MEKRERWKNVILLKNMAIKKKKLNSIGRGMCAF